MGEIRSGNKTRPVVHSVEFSIVRTVSSKLRPRSKVSHEGIIRARFLITQNPASTTSLKQEFGIAQRVWENIMRTLIVGAGRIGMHLIGYLSSNEENKLTVIEKKRERCKEVSDKFDAVILNEDGSKPDIMKQADASQADLLLAATDDDRVNIAVARNAKKDFGIPRVVAVANSPRNKIRLVEAGADVVICPVDLALRDFESILLKDHAITLMYRPEPDLRVAEITIPMTASIIGKKFHELEVPEKCRIALVSRGNTFVFPDSELDVRSGDKVLLMGDGASVQKTVELLKSTETA